MMGTIISPRDQFQTLRARLEPGLVPATVLIVTSAEKNDGKSLTAFGLAESFAKAGYRSVVIDANHSRMHANNGRAVGNVSVDQIDVRACAVQNVGQGYSELVLVNESDANLLSYPQVKAVVDQCRLHYEYVIIDCSEFGTSSLPGLLAKCADGVLVSLRRGRRQTDRDERLVQMIEECGVPVLGIVLVPGPAIKLFAAQSATSAAIGEQAAHPGGLMSPGAAT
jgi:Mrp family chromosome partitioning ATPase